MVRVATSRDRAAFSRIFNYFAPRVKNYLLQANLSPEHAEDITQETMLKVWRKAHLFDPAKAATSTWIFTIARNARIDSLRKINKPALDPDEPQLKPTEEPRADELRERSERNLQIRNAITKLPAAQLDVLKLYFFEDDPHSDIARKLNLPLGTVKSRLRLAFAKIRNELGDLE